MRRILLALLVSCSNPPPPPPPPPPAPEVEKKDDPCVTECERRNMARAVAPEMIRADCERQCENPTTQPAQ